MKFYLVIFFIHLSFGAIAQKGNTYTYVSDSLFFDNPTSTSTSTGGFFFGNSLDYAVREFAGVWRESLRNKRDGEFYERSKSETGIKTETLKRQYEKVANYPDQITDGWHEVIATDNINFCKNAKVLVKDNQITKFVADNWLPIKVVAIGNATIKKAQSIVTLQDYNGQQLNIMEIFFMYDLDKPTLTTEPLKPGYICFWSDLRRFDLIIIKVDGVLLEHLSLKIKNQPDCFSAGMVCRTYKPGIYTLSATGRGDHDWNGTFEIKPGMCLKYKLSK